MTWYLETENLALDELSIPQSIKSMLIQEEQKVDILNVPRCFPGSRSMEYECLLTPGVMGRDNGDLSTNWDGRGN